MQLRIQEINHTNDTIVICPIDDTINDIAQQIRIQDIVRERNFYIVLPFNVNANHWIGVVISATEGRITVRCADSLGMKNILENIRYLVHELLLRTMPQENVAQYTMKK